MQLSTALAFFEIGNRPELLILLLLPAVLGLGALATATALFRHATNANTEQSRIDGYVVVGLNTPGW